MDGCRPQLTSDGIIAGGSAAAGIGATTTATNVDRYLEASQNGGNYTGPRPTARVVTSVTRTWTDANRNFQPDCDLQNPLANGECAQISDLNFGKPIFGNTYDSALLTGWGVRPSDWQVGATVQHEVLPRVSVEAGYFRRWLQGFTVTDNLSQTPADFGSFSVTAPADPRLPGGGGQVIAGLYNANQNVDVTVNLIPPGDLYGDRVNEVDVRIAKILKFGRTRTNVGIDVYNLSNSAAVLTYNQAFIPNGAWLTPTSVLQPRYVKISAQIDF